jgi:hypothetical protein
VLQYHAHQLFVIQCHAHQLFVLQYHAHQLFGNQNIVTHCLEIEHDRTREIMMTDEKH